MYSRIIPTLRYFSSVPADSTKSFVWVFVDRIWLTEDVECISVQNLQGLCSLITGAPSAGSER